MKKTAGFFLQFRKSPAYVFFLVFFFSNAFLSAFFSVGMIGGWNIYTNISTSMEPSIERGDLTIVKRQDMHTYEVGDIVSYYAQINGNTEVITHRIHRIGGNVYITKGDNNDAADNEYLRPRLIIGKVVAVIPYLGYWVMLLKSIAGRLFFILLPMVLIILTESKYLSAQSKK